MHLSQSTIIDCNTATSDGAVYSTVWHVPCNNVATGPFLHGIPRLQLQPPAYASSLEPGQDIQLSADQKEPHQRVKVALCTCALIDALLIVIAPAMCTQCIADVHCC